MGPKSSKSKWSDNVTPSLNAAIEVLNLAKEASNATPANAVFGAVGALLAMIRDSVANEQDTIELGLSCAHVCKALDRGLNGRRADELNQSVLDAIGQLTMTVATIQKKLIKQGKRNAASRLIHAKNDKVQIATWKQDLDRILHIFNTELAINTHTLVADIHRNALAGHESTVNKQPTQASDPLGESPPPPPRACFGRGDLVEKIVGLAENFEPIALIGPGGIGKTSIALTLLHHNRIVERFGENRRFIRCDQFPASRTHLLARLSEVIGAAVENPEDLIPLRPFLSSNEMLIILDNIESILDPQGANAQEIYAIVDELCQFRTICVCITSRITTVPQHCRRPVVPQLTMKAACNIFYNIYDDGGRSDIIKDLVQRLDFHALSITLLATTASRNTWDYDRLAKEWDTRHAQVLRTDFNQSLAATIELSLDSPTFQQLGDGARDLLGVVAFFPQGVDEKNIDRLFFTISDRKDIFDRFCALSLTHRRNGFITMLAPIRDYLCPRDPRSSPLLCAAKDNYFNRLSVVVNPGKPGFGEARWVVSEDTNVEHLLDIFTSLDQDSDDVWSACANFIGHLYWHKRRHTVLKSKIEGLPDDHHFKPQCLFLVARLVGVTGDRAEEKRLCNHVLKLSRDQGDDIWIARALGDLSGANRVLGFYEEGTQQAREASEIWARLGDAKGQARSLFVLAGLLQDARQLGAAEETASRMINLLPERGEEFLVCGSHLLIGDICRSRGERERAIHHFEAAIGIASTSNWSNSLVWCHLHLADLFSSENKFDNAHAHLDQAESHAIDDAYNLGCTVRLRAVAWYLQRRLEEAVSGALRAIEIFEKLGATTDEEACRALLQNVERAMERGSQASGESDTNRCDAPCAIFENNSEGT